jgi:GNAT superfamily N-acetyltransferase
MQEFYAESSYPLDRPWATASLLELLARPELGAIWLAHLGDELAGHVVLTVRHAMEYGGLSAYIDDLFVRPAWRRHGVGRALLAELFRDCRARGCRAVQVEVGADNAPAIRLYGTFGLRPHQDGRMLLSGPISDPPASHKADPPP